MTKLRSLFVALLLAAPLAACTQQVDDVDSTDPVEASASALTTVDAKFARWLPGPTGKPFGMLLEDGSIVRVHHGADESALKPGDAVRVEGVKKGDAFVFAKVSKGDSVVIDAPKHGKHFAHKGWKKGEHKKGEHTKGEHKKDKAAWQAMKDKHAAELASLSDLSVTGTVATLIPGRHGKTAGVILDDGTVAYAPHHARTGELAINKGDTITIAGKGGTYPAGKALVAKSITLPSGEVKTL